MSERKIRNTYSYQKKKKPLEEIVKENYFISLILRYTLIHVFVVHGLKFHKTAPHFRSQCKSQVVNCTSDQLAMNL